MFLSLMDRYIKLVGEITKKILIYIGLVYQSSARTTTKKTKKFIND